VSRRFTYLIHFKDERDSIEVSGALGAHMTPSFLRIDLGKDESLLWFAHEIDHIEQRGDSQPLAEAS
jgi:hypothetical protein